MSANYSPPSTRQRGAGTVITIIAIIGIGIVFLMVFLFSALGNKSGGNGAIQQNAQNNQTDKQQADQNTSKEPPYIRIPENSKIYTNSDYKFAFAYPNGFGELKSGLTDSSVLFSVESAPADKKPVGQGTAFLNGSFGAYVYNRDDFKILVGQSDTYVAPTKTGGDITWKVVSAGAGTKDKVGSSYPVKTIKSQTGVLVFDFSQFSNNQLRGRWVFESGDNYVLIALPYVTKFSGAPLTDADLAAYNIIGANLASTVRTP